MTQPKIGFIGLGLMGRAMVGRLQDRGYDLRVLGHRDRSGIDAAIARGAQESATPREMAQTCEIVMLCMGTSEQVETRIYGDDGVLAGAHPDLVVIDFGTSLPASTIRIGADMAAQGAVYLDAPLGRTPAHAKDGLLNIMCAGDEAAYARVKPVLGDLGENVFHLGKLGNGHTIKLMNNFFGMTTACAMAETFAMADAADIDRQMVYDVMAAGPLRSGMMDMIRNYATEGQVDLAFSVANAAKDVGYYRQMAQDLGQHSRISGAAFDTLSEARDTDDPNRMVPAMVDWMAQNLGKVKP